MDRPNIVYIVADQWRGDCLGLYGNQHPVMTPHLNQLASEGVLFSQAYADCPICMPQRVTMLTGRTGSQMRCITNFGPANAPDFDKSSTLPARLAREAGYQTKAIGKMHFMPARSRYGFDHVTLHPDDYIWWLEDHGYGGGFRGHGLGGNEVYPGVATTPEPFYHSSWIVDQAVRYLDQRDPEVPFFLYMVFEAPHSPFDPPPPYDRMYDNFDIPDPVMGDWVSDAPGTFLQRERSRKWDQLRPDVVREARRRYYGQMSQIDYRLGLLFGALRTHGLDRNTAIVFTADHGESLGDHGQFSKHTFLQSSCRVPLILRLPAADERATASAERTAPVMTADICPTLLELVGLPQDPDAEGVSLLPEVAAHGTLSTRTIFGETPASAMALDARYKYIWYPDGGREQLFDIVADPDDLHDLSGDPVHVAERARLRQLLTTYLAGNASELVADGALVVHQSLPDEVRVRATNSIACRGPMRGGSGY